MSTLADARARSTSRATRSRIASASRWPNGADAAHGPFCGPEHRSVRLLARLALPVRHGSEDGVAPDAVGDGMVELEEERRLAVAHSLVEPRLPERPRAVERRLVGGRDLPEELVAVVRPAQGVAAQMIVEVERRIDLPVRQRHVERRVDDALPQARNGEHRPLDRMSQPGPLGRAVEDEQHRHGGRLHRRVGPPEGQVLARKAHRGVGGHALSHDKGWRRNQWRGRRRRAAA